MKLFSLFLFSLIFILPQKNYTPVKANDQICSAEKIGYFPDRSDTWYETDYRITKTYSSGNTRSIIVTVQQTKPAYRSNGGRSDSWQVMTFPEYNNKNNSYLDCRAYHSSDGVNDVDSAIRAFSKSCMGCDGYYFK